MREWVKNLRTHKKTVLIFMLAMAVLLCGIQIRHYNLPKFHDLTVELGTQSVSLRDFATKYANPKKLAFVSDPAEVNLNRVGETELILSHGGKQETVTLTVADTVAPEVIFTDVVYQPVDSMPAAEDFVERVQDESDTKAYFASAAVIPKDYSDLTVTVVVEDAGGNKTEKDCTLSFRWIPESYALEYGDTLTKEDILMDPVRDAALIDQKELDKINAGGPGAYTVTSCVGDRTAVCQVTVADTRGPDLKVKDVKIRPGGWVTRKSFQESATDISGVAEIRMMNEPDRFTYGRHTVAFEAEDIYGNITTREAVLWVSKENVPPVITGADSVLSVEKGGSLDLMAGVSATDKADGACEVICDTGKLNLNTAGTYYVTYNAWDNSGNQDTVKRKVIVEHDAEDTAALVASIAAKLSDDPERIRDYVRNSISYNHDWGDNDPVWYGFTNRVGNCYVHAMCLKAIYDLKGIENQLIWVTAKSHYWLIVKIDGQWKHIDPTPSTLHGKYSLMNDRQRLSTLSGRKWDTSLWPACE